jgi:large conductance mechanosensitive channel
MSMIKEFKEFALRGNVVDLAVAVVIGGAFGAIVTSLVGDVIMPVVGLLTGGIDFSTAKIILKQSVGADGKPVEVALMYGKFIQAIFNFIVVAFAIFMMVKAMNATKKAEAPAAPAPAPEPSNEEKLLAEIRDLLKKQ